LAEEECLDPHGLSEKIKSYWSEKAEQRGLDPRATTFDFNQKQLEVEDVFRFFLNLDRENIKILDIGCGTGYLSCELAQKGLWEIHGVDYSDKIIEVCNQRRELLDDADKERLFFRCADVLDLPYESQFFDVVIGERILINLPSLEQQKRAVQEIARVLKPQGFYLMFEGSKEGLQRLNNLRKLYGLYEIGDHWTQFKIEEKTFIPFLENHFNVINLKRYGMFYFLSRIIHPLLVAPEEPKYDAPINNVARYVASFTSNYEDIGHLIFITLRKGDE